MRKIWLSAVALTLAAAGGCSSGHSKPQTHPTAPTAGQAAPSYPPCDKSGVVYCGAYPVCSTNTSVPCGTIHGQPSLRLFIEKLLGGEVHYSSEQKLARFFNEPAEKVISKIDRSRWGEMTQAGDVLLNGIVVAHNTFFASRRPDKMGSMEHRGLYLHNPSGLPSAQEPALVSLDNNGNFLFGILAINGDPIVTVQS